MKNPSTIRVTGKWQIARTAEKDVTFEKMLASQ